MINSVTITNHLGEEISLELRYPEKSGFLIQNIEGLGPNKASINMSDIAGFDGGFYNSSRILSRNIVFKIYFLLKPDIETSRQKSYKYFPLGKRIKIVISSDNRDLVIYGYVESNEPYIFEKNVYTLISIICPDPYLRDIEDTITYGGNIIPLFEFPFSNEHLTNNLIELSEMLADTVKSVVYDGDLNTGFIIRIHAIGAASDIEIINNETLDSMFLDSTIIVDITGGDIQDGDDIYISSIKGSKYIKLIRSTVEYNIINCLGTYPTWFELHKGDNVFSLDAASGLSNLTFEFRHRQAYEGV